ncbi:MAG TPA: hypothetical protein VFK09_11650, partial [Gemmatimonadales bacterium]|nr:hypothetical protein [Gemmatimonadales bacterium]
VAERLAIAAEREAIALAVMRAAVLGRELAGLPDELAAAAAAARRMAEARYVAMVHEADPDARDAADPQRAEGLIALAHALNAPTRCALVSLRAGGNRSGADAVLTWQTGYPMAIDMSAGYPQYHAHHPASALHGRIRAALVVGAAAAVPESVRPLLASVPVGIVGPRASEAPFAAEVAIDTGIAGIHEAGTAYRMDDVPLPLSQVLAGPPAPAEVLRELGGALAGRRRT